MERRRAVAIAAAATATTLGAVAAIAANFGLLGFGQARAGQVGKLEAGRVSQLTVDASNSSAPAPGGPGVAVRYEDVYLPAPSVPPATTSAPAAAAGGSAAASPAVAASPGDGVLATAADGQSWDDRPTEEQGEHEQGQDRDRGGGEHEEDD